MLTHTINKYVQAITPEKVGHAASNKARFHGEFGTEEHKRFIHKRVLELNVWNEGDHCKVNGDLGVVCHICTDYADAEWGTGKRSLECKCVEVFLYSENESHLFHPSVLTTR